MSKINSRVDVINVENYQNLKKVVSGLHLYMGFLGLKTNFLPKNYRVVIKPNWVMHNNPVEDRLVALVTNSSLIGAVIDWLVESNPARTGSVTIADAPLQSCRFNDLVNRAGITRMVAYYRHKYRKFITISVIDLRKTIMFKSEEKQISGAGDPMGYSLINLGSASLFSDVGRHAARLRVTNYNPSDLLRHHTPNGIHEYLISNSVLDADLIINMPKAKTHIKAGLTGALKNMVGINGHKEYLPHHTQGSFDEGGDQFKRKNIFKTVYNRLYDYYWHNLDSLYPPIKLFLKYILKMILLFAFLTSGERHVEGSWSGNITVARMTIDLNNILYFWNKKTKKLSFRPQRNILTVMDGIISGQGQGPLRPKSKKTGFVLIGSDPLGLDMILAKLIGFTDTLTPTLFLGKNSPQSMFSKLKDVIIYIDGKKVILNDIPSLKFLLPRYW